MMKRDKARSANDGRRIWRGQQQRLYTARLIRLVRSHFLGGPLYGGVAQLRVSPRSACRRQLPARPNGVISAVRAGELRISRRVTLQSTHFEALRSLASLSTRRRALAPGNLLCQSSASGVTEPGGRDASRIPSRRPG